MSWEWRWREWVDFRGDLVLRVNINVAPVVFIKYIEMRQERVVIRHIGREKTNVAGTTGGDLTGRSSTATKDGWNRKMGIGISVIFVRPVSGIKKKDVVM